MNILLLWFTFATTIKSESNRIECMYSSGNETCNNQLPNSITIPSKPFTKLYSSDSIILQHEIFNELASPTVSDDGNIILYNANCSKFDTCSFVTVVKLSALDFHLLWRSDIEFIAKQDYCYRYGVNQNSLNYYPLKYIRNNNDTFIIGQMPYDLFLLKSAEFKQWENCLAQTSCL